MLGAAMRGQRGERQTQADTVNSGTERHVLGMTRRIWTDVTGRGEFKLCLLQCYDLVGTLPSFSVFTVSLSKC